MNSHQPVSRHQSIPASSLSTISEPGEWKKPPEDPSSRDNVQKVVFVEKNEPTTKKAVEKSFSLNPDDGKMSPSASKDGVFSPAVTAELYWRQHMDSLLRNGIGKKQRSHSITTSGIRYEDTQKPCSSEYHRALIDAANETAEAVQSNNSA